jgi:hypothetical protein
MHDGVGVTQTVADQCSRKAAGSCPAYGFRLCGVERDMLAA